MKYIQIELPNKVRLIRPEKPIPLTDIQHNLEGVCLTVQSDLMKFEKKLNIDCSEQTKNIQYWLCASIYQDPQWLKSIGFNEGGIRYGKFLRCKFELFNLVFPLYKKDIHTEIDTPSKLLHCWLLVDRLSEIYQKKINPSWFPSKKKATYTYLRLRDHKLTQEQKKMPIKTLKETLTKAQKDRLTAMKQMMKGFILTPYQWKFAILNEAIEVRDCLISIAEESEDPLIKSSYDNFIRSWNNLLNFCQPLLHQRYRNRA